MDATREIWKRLMSDESGSAVALVVRHGKRGGRAGLFGLALPLLYQHRLRSILQERQVDLEDPCH